MPSALPTRVAPPRPRLPGRLAPLSSPLPARTAHSTPLAARLASPRRLLCGALFALACAALAAPALSALAPPPLARVAGAAAPPSPRGLHSWVATTNAFSSSSTTASAATAARPSAYASGVVVVKYAFATAPPARAAIARAAGAVDPLPVASHTRLLRLRPGESVSSALVRLRGQHDVQWAVPDYLAHAAEVALPPPLYPNDPGTGGAPGDWRLLQWNFVGPFGVGAPQAWGNLVADGAPGGAGRGVVVAVLDTGIAYANRGPFRRSPDFNAGQFVAGYDFVAHSPYANDRNGHGTQVAGTIAEATGNHYGLTGLAYGVRLMPVRVLNAEGEGDASTIAQGIRFAVNHGASVINLSLEFSSDVSSSDIPELVEALRYAYRRGVVVVAASGNEGQRYVAFPARVSTVISVGATTEHGCLASYSNDGPALTLVAPGGGPDADLPHDPNCRPEEPSGNDIYQETFTGSSPRRFGFPSGYEGTSMATPHVTATVALVIASRVLGRHPSPPQLLARLRATARPLGGPRDRARYGAGLVNAGAATAPGGPGAVG
jgi:serine protease